MMTESIDPTRGHQEGHPGQYNWTHVLTDFTPVDELSSPLRKSARLKYTCIAVSRRYIALGANTGAVYIFGRETLKHLQVVLAEKDSSPVNHVCFGPIDNRLAYSYSNGNVVVVELNIEKRGKPERIRLSIEHSNYIVTALQWDTVGARLFSGDNFGKVSAALIPVSKAKDLFQTPSEVIARVDSAVVQLDWSVDRLLVSTVTRCYLCYTSRQQYGQIGKKLRDGKFGACFYPSRDGQQPSIYCARPGSRIWEVDFGGTVLNTHQFKQLLAIPSFPVIEICDKELDFPDRLKVDKPQALAFPQLTVISDTYLFSWTKTGLYVLDPVSVKVITWVQYLSEVTEVKCYKNEAYLFSGSTGHVRKLQLLPVPRCISVLVSKDHWSIAGQLCGYFAQLLIDSQPYRYLSHITLSKLYEHLVTLTLMDLAEKVKAILDAFSSQDSQEDQNEIVRLNSGIYQVNDGRRLDSDDESLPTPSSSQSLSRRSSTSSLQAYFSDNALSSPAINKQYEGSVFSMPNNTENSIAHNQTVVESINYNDTENKQVLQSFDSTDGLSIDSSQKATSMLETGNEKQDFSELTHNHNANGESENLAGTCSIPLSKDEGYCENSAVNNIYDDSVSDKNPYNPRITSVANTNSGAKSSSDDSALMGISADSRRLTFGDKNAGIKTSNDDLEIMGSSANSRRDAFGFKTAGLKSHHDDSAFLESSVESRRHSVGGFVIGHGRTGSMSSLSSISSNELTLEPVMAEPVATTKGDIVRKSPKKKKASQPLILGPGEKRESRGPVRRSLSTGSSRKQNARRRAISDLGPVSAIQEVVSEVDKQDKAPVDDGQIRNSSDNLTPGMSVVTNSESTVRSSSPVIASPLMRRSSSPNPAQPSSPATLRPASPLMQRSSSPKPTAQSSRVIQRTASPLLIRPSSQKPVRSTSPIDCQESSPSDSPLVHSWESSGMTGPKATLRSVKDSLSSKIFSTKKNLMRTLREKRSLFGSREMLHGGDYSDDQNERTMLRKGRTDSNAGFKVVDDGPKSEVDLSVLRKATQRTKQSLNSTSTLLNPEPVLREWLKTLHRTLHQLRKVHLEKHLLEKTEQGRDSVFISQESSTTNQTVPNIKADIHDKTQEANNGQTNNLTENSTTESGNIDHNKNTINDNLRTNTGDPIEIIDNDQNRDVKDSSGDTRYEDSNMTGDSFDSFDRNVLLSDVEKSDKQTRSGSDTEKFCGSDVIISDQNLPQTTSTKIVNDNNNVSDIDNLQSQEEDILSTDIETESTISLPSESESETALKDSNIISEGHGNNIEDNSFGTLGNSKSVPSLTRKAKADSVSSVSLYDARSFETEPTTVFSQSITESDMYNSREAGSGRNKSSYDISPEIDWSRLCYLSDPFLAGPELSFDISYLLNISFSLGLHCHLSSYMNPEIDLDSKSNVNGQSTNNDNAATNGHKSGEALELTEVEQISLSNDLSDGHKSMNIFEPKSSKEKINLDLGFPENSNTKDDKELSLFVRCYFPYLSLDRVRDLLSTSQRHGYSTWLALLDCFKGLVEKDSVSVKLSENNVNGALDLLRSGIIQNRFSVLGHLPRLFELSTKKTVEYCVEDSSHISPLDVLYMCELVKKPLQDVFYPYMIARYNTTSHPGHLKELCCNRSVRRTWLQGLLSQGEVKVTKTDTGAPLPGSHLYPWKHSNTISAFIGTFLMEETSFILQLSLEYGYWLGCLDVYEHAQRRQEGLQLVVRLGDITLLASPAWSPVCVEEWKTVLTIMASQTEGYDGCSPLVSEEEQSTEDNSPGHMTLNWNSIALLLVQSIESQKAIELLQTTALPENSISQEFYQALIVATLGVKHKRSLLHNILEKTDIYLWAKKPTQIAPQLHYAVEEERKIVSAGREGKQTQVFKDMFTQLESQSDFVTHRFVEDLECHWGVRCDLNRVCPCCGLQLSAPVSNSQPGVIVFHCGHGYHRFCHQDKVCQECSEEFKNSLVL